MRTPALLDDIVRSLAFPDDYDLFLEYTVRPPQGRGKASHTDVMLRSGPRSLAIEAKWTEPMYETVKKWLKAGKDPANRTAVLGGWHGLLCRHATREFQLAALDDSIYQMVHRAASAVAAGQSPCLAYFLFKPSEDDRAATTDQILGKLTQLWETLGSPATFPFHLVEVKICPRRRTRRFAP